jgi:predicted dehydrogenase
VSGPTTEPLRIGILGAARITELALVTPSLATGDRLVAVAARDPERAAEFAERHGVDRVHASYAELIADPEVELVYNPLANALHTPWNLAAIAAGKHVLCEKPFAANAVEAREVRAAAVAAGVTVVEGFHYVHHPVATRLYELIDAGELGKLRRVETHTEMPAPPDDDPRWSLELAGGALMDLGCYGLHAQRMLGRWAGGPPRLVGARGGERAGRPGVDEWVDAVLEFPSGAIGFARCDMAADDWRITCRIVGERGEVLAHNYLLPHRDDRISVSSEDGVRDEHVGTRSTYLYQLEALRRHLREGDRYPVDVEDAVLQAELVDQVYREAGFSPRPRYAAARSR